jgi:hypothetical protein
MLVCNVSLLQRRAAIAVDLAEAAAALDTPGTGNVVFATLVDDPASVGDHVDAFLGQIMLEAASASSTVTAGLAYAAAIVEAATAIDAASASRQTSDAVAETVAADSAQDATVVSAPIVSGTVTEAASAADLVNASVTAGLIFGGMLALDGPIMPGATAPAVIYIEG